MLLLSCSHYSWILQLCCCLKQDRRQLWPGWLVNKPNASLSIRSHGIDHIYPSYKQIGSLAACRVTNTFLYSTITIQMLERVGGNGRQVCGRGGSSSFLGIGSIGVGCRGNSGWRPLRGFCLTVNALAVTATVATASSLVSHVLGSWNFAMKVLPSEVLKGTSGRR